jgi:glutathione S-transferase
VAGLAGLQAGTAQQVLDAEAIAEYRNRLKQLDTEIEERDPDQSSQARAERDWLLAQLSSAAGFAGRTRAFPDQPERARVAAGKAIRRAMARITEADPVIGEHLRQTVHTGVRCSYWLG